MSTASHGREVLGLGFEGPFHHGGAEGMVDVQAADDATRTMLEALYFSRWFIITFQGALVGIVGIFAGAHWWGRWRRRRRGSAGGGKRGDEGKVGGGAGERSALLPSRAAEGADEALLCRLHRTLRAAAMYQPRPLPFINKVLPSNATTLLVLTLLALNLFYLSYADPNPFDIELTFSLGNRAGLLFVAHLPWLYLLAAKTQPLKPLTGLSYENLNILHRRQGELMATLAALHLVGMLCSWYAHLRPTGMGLGEYLRYPIIWLGVGALLCYEGLYLTSLAGLRQWWYEIFLATHVGLQAVGLVLLFLHHPITRPYTGISLGIFLADRVVFRAGLKSRTLGARLRVLDERTLMVSADWPLRSRWRSLSTLLFGCDIVYGWQPSEHVFLSVPCLAPKHIIQAHPFTIGSAAPENGQQHAWFDLIVRVHDGFTKDLTHYARARSMVQVRVDGPYGSLHTLEMLRAADHAVLVAGGSGIAVAYPLLWTLLHGDEVDTEGQRRNHLHLIWIVQDAQHADWIGYERLDELREKGVRVCVPTPTSKAGRPDVGALVRGAVGECRDDGNVGVMVSGPDSMNRTVRNLCADLVWRGTDVDVAVEKYAW